MRLASLVSLGTLVAVLNSCLPAGLGAPQPAPSATPNRVRWLGGNWFLVGYNFPWHQYNYDFGPEEYSNVRYYYQKIENQFADLQANGTRVTRWYVFNNASQYPRFDSQGQVTGLGSQFFQNFDDALAIASAYNIYLIPVLLDATLTERASGAPRQTIITDPAIRQSYLDNAVRPLLERYGRHPNILAWSIFNEPEWPAGFTSDNKYNRISVDTLRDFISLNVQYIHQYASQPAALDSGGFPWFQRWTDLGVDLYLVHWYPWIDRDYPGFSPLERTADSYNVDKPIVVAEFPIKATPYSVRRSLDGIYANGYAGALAWCYPNNTDEWCDATSYNRTKTELRRWADAHSADVSIR